jgi:glutamate/tyrosine decarboxylase-like PLP-dependent enzyme
MRNPIYRGITSFSADYHKYGTTPKGLSFVAFRKSVISGDNLPANICALRSASQLEVALATLLHIGKKGYEERALAIAALGKALSLRLAQIDGIEIVGAPKDQRAPRFVIAFRLEEPLKHLTYAMGRLMGKLGWQLSHLKEYTLHMLLTNAHKNNPQFLSKFISDLEFVVQVLQSHRSIKPQGTEGLYGMAANVNLPSLLGTNKTKRAFLKLMVNLYGDFLISAQ